MISKHFIKKIIFLSLICLATSSCLTRTWFKPKDFTYQYDGENTGLDSLINIEGCFTSNNFQENHPRYIVFFRDGLICLPDVAPEKNKFKKTYPKEMTDKHIWGKYIVEGNQIKIQQVLDTGADGGVIINQYTLSIESPIQIKLIAWGNKGTTVPVQNIVYNFQSLENRIDSSSCWLFKKRWFYKK